MQALEHIDDPAAPVTERVMISVNSWWWPSARCCRTTTPSKKWWRGRYKQDWLRGFLKLANGIPSEDTFIRVFRLLDPKQFEQAFRDWAGNILPALES